MGPGRLLFRLGLLSSGGHRGRGRVGAALKSRGRRPGLGARAAVVGRQHADRDGTSEHLVQSSPTEEANGAERAPCAVLERAGAAHRPVKFIPRAVDIIQRRERRVVLDGEHAKVGVVDGVRDLRGGVHGGRHGELHVRLASAQQNIAEQHVAQRHTRTITIGERQRVAHAGRVRADLERERAVLSRLLLLRVLGAVRLSHREGNRCAGVIRPSPDHRAAVALQHHVVAQQRRQTDARLCHRSEGAREQQRSR